jgi:hypothetical protein
MRIFRLCPTPRHARDIRERYSLEGRPFAEEIEVYRTENLLLPGSWAKCMADEGFEVFETCYNDLQLQESWARENSCGYLAAEPDSLFKILEAQINLFHPEILFLYAGVAFIITRDVRDRIRRIAPKDMSIAVYWGDEIPPGQLYADYFGDIDIAFCSSPIYQ